MNEELKPCPFCGHTKSRVMKKKIAGSRYCIPCSYIQYRYYVMCNKCYAKGGSIVSERMAHRNTSPYCPVEYTQDQVDIYKKKAIDAWNRRTEK